MGKEDDISMKYAAVNCMQVVFVSMVFVLVLVVVPLFATILVTDFCLLLLNDQKHTIMQKKIVFFLFTFVRI